jgi:hypothetical protein
MTVTSKRKKEPVILWGDELCLWIGVLDEIGLRPAAIILPSMDAIHLVQGVVGIECFVRNASEFEAVLLPLLRENAGWVWWMVKLLGNFVKWHLF